MREKTTGHFLLTVALMYFLALNNVSAEGVSTPDPVIQMFPNILINEVSFKDSSNDWIEIYIKDDLNSGSGANIKGLKVIDDSAFFTIINDFIVHSGDYLIINFKSETENFSDAGNLITFNIKRTGLTGTTEQVVLKNPGNEIIDAVCWANTTPTESEISDFAEIAEANQWSQNISTCLSSETVSNNNSIQRKTLNDTNTQNDWAVQTAPTKGTTNILTVQQTTAATPDPAVAIASPFTSNSISYDEENEPINNPINTCEKIYINEFLPNPQGTDTGNEWIELYNPDAECIMDGWIIDDLEGGSKPFYIYNKKVLTNGFLLLPSWETKINLNNTGDSVRLFNNQNEITEKTDYLNAKENFSYAKTIDHTFEWTDILTPLGKNAFKEADAEDDDDPEESEAATVKTTSKSTKTSSSKTVKNGNLSDKIFIWEVFPNPKGTDKGSEWIEIYNDSEDEVNLGGWRIDLGEGSTKKYIFDNTIIESKEFLVLSDADMGLTLKNSDGELRLLDYEDTVIDTLNYESAAENSSYMKIKIISETEEEFEWKWTSNFTQGAENQTLYKYTAVISLIDEKTGSLELTLPAQNNKITAKMIQSGDNGGDSAFAQELKINAEAEFILSKTETNEFIVEDFQILKEPQESGTNNDQGLIYLILSSLPPAGVLGYYGIKKLGLIKFISG